jgi:hypothetical protein
VGDALQLGELRGGVLSGPSAHTFTDPPPDSDTWTNDDGEPHPDTDRLAAADPDPDAVADPNASRELHRVGRCGAIEPAGGIDRHPEHNGHL